MRDPMLAASEDDLRGATASPLPFDQIRYLIELTYHQHIAGTANSTRIFDETTDRTDNTATSESKRYYKTLVI